MKHRDICERRTFTDIPVNISFGPQPCFLGNSEKNDVSDLSGKNVNNQDLTQPESPVGFNQKNRDHEYAHVQKKNGRENSKRMDIHFSFDESGKDVSAKCNECIASLASEDSPLAKKVRKSEDQQDVQKVSSESMDTDIDAEPDEPDCADPLDIDDLDRTT